MIGLCALPVVGVNDLRRSADDRPLLKLHRNRRRIIWRSPASVERGNEQSRLFFSWSNSSLDCKR
jgi:hypothetical protein